MKNIILLIASMLLLFSCKEEGRLDYFDDSKPAPAQVDNVEVTNRQGAALIKYSIPQDKNLLYVKAVYTIRDKEVREVKASYFSDTLLVDGFARAGEYKVSLFSVGRNEKQSEPVIIDVLPEAPPVETVIHDIILQESFGGVKVSFKNPTRANLAIGLLIDTLEAKGWEPLHMFYTKSEEGIFSFRGGLDTIPLQMGVYIRDRWNNTSDTVKMMIKPIYEQIIPKPYREYNLPSDSYAPAEGSNNYKITSLWDGITGNVNSGIFANTHDSPMPQTFTVDLKTHVVISRIKLHQRKNYSYVGNNVKTFELYGSSKENPGPGDDLLSSDWELLGTFTSVKPSGEEGVVTKEDEYYANVTGEDFELISTPEVVNPWKPVRYIRVRTLETFNGPSDTGQITIAELSVFGTIEKK